MIDRSERLSLGWRGLYKPEQASGREARMMYAAANAIAEHGGSMPLNDAARAAGMSKTSPAFRRMLLADGRFMLKKQVHRPIVGNTRMSLAVYVHLINQGAACEK